MVKLRSLSRFERLEREEINPLPRTLTLNKDEYTVRSPVEPKNGLHKSLPQAVMARQSGGPKAASTAAALRAIELQLDKFTEKDFADPSSRKKYRDLRRVQIALEASPRNVPVQPKAKVFSGPLGREWPVTTSGTAARYSAFTSVDGRPQLRRKSLLLPCVERYVRKQVLFAKGLAGKGYRTPHRRNKNSWIPC